VGATINYTILQVCAGIESQGIANIVACAVLATGGASKHKNWACVCCFARRLGFHQSTFKLFAGTASGTCCTRSASPAVPAVLRSQSLKDAMIVTSCGAEALPLISAFGVLPASVLFIMYYDKLVSCAAR
jgi:hypothetical protein